MLDLDDLLLEPEEFERLSPRSRRRYLAVLAAVQAEKPVELLPKQQMAEHLASFCDELLYGGAAGGAKSFWLLQHQHHLCLTKAGHAGLYLRATYPALEMSAIQTSIVYFAKTPEAQRPIWRASRKRWEYHNGSVLQFGHCEEFADVYRYLSTEWDTITIDELTEILFEPYELLITRARTNASKVALGIRPHVVGASNPGNRGHGWCMRRFPLNPEGEYGPNGEPGGVEVIEKTYRNPVTGEDDVVQGHVRRIAITMPDESIEHKTIGFVRSTVLDNPHMPESYIKQLAASSENRRRQYLDGDWTVHEGQFFGEFRRTKHVKDEGEQAWHVVEPFELPPDWYRAHAVDYGYAQQFGCLWGAWDPEGCLYIYREAYEAGLTPGEQAKLVKKMTRSVYDGERFVEKTFGLGDPQAWARHTGPSTVAVQWAQAGMRLAKADNERLGGWAKIREYLLPMPTVVDGRATVRPALRIMSNCTNLIRTLPELNYSKTKPEDLDTREEDHLADCLRYLCNHRPRAVRKPEPDKPGLEGRLQRQQRDLKNGRRRTRQPSELGKPV